MGRPVSVRPGQLDATALPSTVTAEQLHTALRALGVLDPRNVNELRWTGGTSLTIGVRVRVQRGGVGSYATVTAQLPIIRDSDAVSD